MRKSFATIALLTIACTSAPASAPPSATSIKYVTQDECHPEVPSLDPRDPRIVAPKLLSKVEPVFPEEVRAARGPLDEVVIVESVIDEYGNVSDVCALKGDPRLVGPTIAAMRQWKFTPGTLDGRPSPFRFASTANYHLH